MEPFFNCTVHSQLSSNLVKHSIRFLLEYASFYSIILIVWSNVFCGTSVRADSSGDGVADVNTLPTQTANHVIDYIHALKRSQDEIFRKIDLLTKAVEEKDHEEYQFRLKFSRKVHTLESKVLYMEHTFTQKMEEVVQKKVDELMAAKDSRLQHGYNRRTISGSSSSNSQNSHGSSSSNGGGDGEDRDPVMNIQNHQPSLYNSIHPHPPSYHRYQSNYPHNQHHPSYNYNYRNQNSNWGFYEHPITQKRVRDSQTNLFGFQPPTRDLPLISMVATTATATEPQQNSRIISDGVKGGPSSSSSRRTLLEVEETTGERHATKHNVSLAEFIEDTKKKFESYDKTLQSLGKNVTNLEKELFRTIAYQNMEQDNTEIHRLLVETRKDVAGLHQTDQEMVHKIEHFTVEIEKAAARREYAVNESLKEMSSELRKQISAVKSYAKKQVQNITAAAGSGVVTVTGENSQTPDKLRCAQTLLDELLAQLGKPKKHPSQVTQYDSIADQAGNEEQNGNDRALFYMSRRSSDKQSTEHLLKELATQRKDIMDLKSEIGKLNISQILLMRTVDQETMKRTVRPRDCTEIRLLRNSSNGIYSIFPKMNDVSTEVYCDMQTDGGGWTVIQRRGAPILLESGNGTRESFARSWEEYDKGFGSLQGDFWFGLSNIAQLCQFGIQELRIDLTNWEGETRFAKYQYFKISNATRLYRINVNGYSGTAGDSLSRHNGMAFSTPDKDHDTDPRRHCAKTYLSGWWFYACFESNLNGLYIGEKASTHHYTFGTGVIWHHWMDNDYSLKIAEMKIRNRFI